MESTTEVSVTSHRNFLLSASSNGIFVELFSINGWLFQVFAVDILVKHKSLVDSLVLAYPIVMILELCSLALLAFVNYTKLLFISLTLRSLLVLAMVIPGYLGILPAAVPVLYYLGFFFHIAGFYVCWPLFVTSNVQADRRGYILGLARAYTNFLSLSALVLIFLAGKYTPVLAAPIGLAVAVLASGLALSGIRLKDNGTGKVAIYRDGGERPGTPPKDIITSLPRLASSRTLRKIAAETLAMAVLVLPLPLFFLPQTGLISNADIIVAFIAGTVISICTYPAFGKLMDRSQLKAFRLILAAGIASVLAIATVLTLQNAISPSLASAVSFMAIGSNFVILRLAGLFSYKRSLDTTERRLTAASAMAITWTFDLGVWSVVTAMQFMPKFASAGAIASNYTLICLVSVIASTAFLFLARQQQAPKPV